MLVKFVNPKCLSQVKMHKANILNINNLEEIIENFSKGKIICIPTDTIYAISSDATNESAIKKIYQIKHRPLNKTLPIFVSDITMAQDYISFSSKQLAFVQKFWPGALTIVSKIEHSIKLPSILINKKKLAVRMPKNRLIQNICRRLNRPIIATSANISSHPNSKNCTEIKQIFTNAVDMIVESSLLKDNNDQVPSTIIELTNNNQFQILREGGITSEELRDCLKSF